MKLGQHVWLCARSKVYNKLEYTRPRSPKQTVGLPGTRPAALKSNLDSLAGAVSEQSARENLVAESP